MALDRIMALNFPALNSVFSRNATVRDTRRLLALPGVLAIVGALLTAAVSFAILVGVTPLTPDAVTTWTLIAINAAFILRSEEHTSELQSRENLVCRLLLEKKKRKL